MVPGHKLVLEFQGHQHYQTSFLTNPGKLSNSKEEGLKNQQERDLKKVEKAQVKITPEISPTPIISFTLCSQYIEKKIS